MTEKESICLYCNKPLRSGRSDKKFCNEGCRNQYHNDQKIADNKETNKINGILKNNRKILKEFLNDSPSIIIGHEALLKKGFEFDYHTHYITSLFKIINTHSVTTTGTGSWREINIRW